MHWVLLGLFALGYWLGYLGGVNNQKVESKRLNHLKLCRNSEGVCECIII